MAVQHYLDYNATAPIRPEVIARMSEVMAQTGNPSSAHSFGRKARAIMEQARSQIAQLVKVSPEQVVFTGSGTEANNHIIRAFDALPFYPSAIEHDAVLNVKEPTALLPVTQQGSLDLDALDPEKLKGALVAVMVANNETGVIQPVASLKGLAAHLHLDAVQAAGKIPLDFNALGADSISISAHKMGGPQGIAALILRAGLEIPPLLRGGSQERKRRAGTENVAAIAGFAMAAQLAEQNMEQEHQRLSRLRQELAQRLQQRYPAVQIIGQSCPRLPNCVLACFPDQDAQSLLIQYDLKGIAVSSGSACSSGKVLKSHVLRAMALPDHVARGAIRFSFGWATQSLPLELI